MILCVAKDQRSESVLRLTTYSLLTIFILTFLGCSRPNIKLSQATPPTFQLSGNNVVLLFEVGNESGGIIWRLYPRSKGVSLKQLSTIKYGEIPSSCEQVVPEDATPPPPLLEGKEYYAVAVIFDDAAVHVRFTIKDGKVLELHHEPQKDPSPIGSH